MMCTFKTWVSFFQGHHVLLLNVTEINFIVQIHNNWESYFKRLFQTNNVNRIAFMPDFSYKYSQKNISTQHEDVNRLHLDWSWILKLYSNFSG